MSDTFKDATDNSRDIDDGENCFSWDDVGEWGEKR